MQDLHQLKTDLADLVNDGVERRYRERPYTYFGRILRRIRGLRDDELARLLEDATERGGISEEEAEDIRLLDVIVLGRNTQGQQIYLAVEASAVIDEHNVARAVRRANLLAKATGEISLPVVAGDSTSPEGLHATQQAGLWRVIHGAAMAPGA